MSTTNVASPSYITLIRRYPLRPIRTKAGYKVASAVLDGLAVRGEDDLDDGERDYLETLELLIEAYDSQHFRIGPDQRAPSERLKYLMGQSGTNPVELMKVLGVSQSLVSLLLSGKRELTRSHIVKLADHFNVDPSYFF